MTSIAGSEWGCFNVKHICLGLTQKNLWRIIYFALQAFHNFEDVVLPAVNSPTDASPTPRAMLSCSNLLALHVEGTTGEEKESRPVEKKSVIHILKYHHNS